MYSLPAAAKEAHALNHPVYKVFVSSTYRDNVKRRRVLIQAIEAAGMQAICMESMTASIRPTVSECLRQARNSDILLVVVAWRYGWIPPHESKSITELEYAANRKRLVFEIDPEAPVSVERDFDSQPDRWQKQEKLESFRREYRLDQMPCVFHEDELGLKVMQALVQWKEDNREAALATLPSLEASQLMAGTVDADQRVQGSKASTESVEKAALAGLSAEKSDKRIRVPKFHYGSVVPVEYFINRENELAEAERIIRASQSFLLVGIRRSGKTSFCKKLIHQMMGRKGNSILAVYVNLQQAAELSLSSFLEHTIISVLGEVVRQVFGCKYTDMMRDDLKEFRPDLFQDPAFVHFERLFKLVVKRTHGPSGRPMTPLDTHEFLAFDREVLDILQAKGWTGCVVFYDEANRLPGNLSVEFLRGNEEALSAAGITSVYAASPEIAETFQPLEEVFRHTVLLGPFSETTVMCKLISKYYFGESSRFKDLPVSQEALDLIWAKSHGMPYLIQRIAGESFRIASDDGAKVLSMDHTAFVVDLIKEEIQSIIGQEN